MNQTDRQTYKDSTAIEAHKKGYDIVQLKYDGWWSRIEILNGSVQFYSRTGRLFREQPIADLNLSCTLIGEHMQGTQWSQQPGRLGRTFLFDCWRWETMDVSTLPYHNRYKIMRLALGKLPETFEQVMCYRFEQRDELWKTQVESGAFEGLVYKRSHDDITGTLLREKRIFTKTYRALAFIKGTGKFEGTLGAIVIGELDGTPIIDSSGEAATVSGGTMTNEERQTVFDNQSAFLNKPFDAEGRAMFESGLLRHPNFICWRLDLQ